MKMYLIVGVISYVPNFLMDLGQRTLKKNKRFLIYDRLLIIDFKLSISVKNLGGPFSKAPWSWML